MPVGPSTNAAAFCCSARPDATLVVATPSRGARLARSSSVSRSTVPWCTTDMVCWTPPFSTLVTNRSAIRPCTAMVESQGPLMPCPRKVSATRPLRLSTIRQPALAVAALPFFDGRLPTTTQPPLQHLQRGGQPDAAGAPARDLPVEDMGEQRAVPGRADLDDRLASALRVRLGVEVADEHVAAVQPADALPDDEDAVRVDVAVLRHGRRDGGQVVELVDEGVVRHGRRGLGNRRCH